MERAGPSPAHKWAPIVIAAIGTLSELQYVLETRIETADEPDTFLFISFLIWPLGAAAIAVIVNAIRHAPAIDQPGQLLNRSVRFEHLKLAGDRFAIARRPRSVCQCVGDALPTAWEGDGEVLGEFLGWRGCSLQTDNVESGIHE